jgi:hypothetical protein
MLLPTSVRVPVLCSPPRQKQRTLIKTRRNIRNTDEPVARSAGGLFPLALLIAPQPVEELFHHRLSCCKEEVKHVGNTCLFPNCGVGNPGINS